jgi:mono/diheme cytochrome c family protein
VRAAGYAAALAAGWLLVACGQDDTPTSRSASPSPTSAPSAEVGDPAKGRRVWVAQCIVCHNNDPSKDGPVGPAVKGSSSELLKTRVLHATYPPGYKPKRDSKVMPARPDLASSIPDLAAYLR